MLTPIEEEEIVRFVEKMARIRYPMSFTLFRMKVVEITQERPPTPLAGCSLRMELGEMVPHAFTLRSSSDSHFVLHMNWGWDELDAYVPRTWHFYTISAGRCIESTSTLHLKCGMRLNTGGNDGALVLTKQNTP